MRNKECISAKIPSIFIAHEHSINHPNLNNSLNHVITVNGTKTIISPITSKQIKNLKYYFSFLLSSQKVIKTECGLILVTPDETNEIYLNGQNMRYIKRMLKLIKCV